MSRVIDWQKPLSPEDEKYAAQFAINQPLIALNKAQFPTEPDAESLAGESVDEVRPYEEWSAQELKAECQLRKLSAKGTVAELAARLRQDDEDVAAAEAEAAANAE